MSLDPKDDADNEVREGLRALADAVRQNARKTTQIQKDLGEGMNAFADAVVAEVRAAMEDALRKALKEAVKRSPDGENGDGPREGAEASAKALMAQAQALMEQARQRDAASLAVAEQAELARGRAEKAQAQAETLLRAAEGGSHLELLTPQQIGDVNALRSARDAQRQNGRTDPKMPHEQAEWLMSEARELAARARKRDQDSVQRAQEVEQLRLASEEKARQIVEAAREESNAIREAAAAELRTLQEDMRQDRQRAIEDNKRVGENITRQMREIAEKEIAAWREDQMRTASAEVAQNETEAALLLSIKRCAERNAEEIVRDGAPGVSEDEAIEALDRILERLSPAPDPFRADPARKGQRFQNALALGAVRIGK